MTVEMESERDSVISMPVDGEAADGEAVDGEAVDGDEGDGQALPEEVTLPTSTVAYLMDRPELMEEMQAVTGEGQGSTARLIEWLDAHGLRWRPGGSDPLAAFADAFGSGHGSPFDRVRADRVRTKPTARVDPEQAARRKEARTMPEKACRTARKPRRSR